MKSNYDIIGNHIGADFGFDRIRDALGACRGAVCLFKQPQKNSRKRRKLRTSSLITCIGPSTLAVFYS